MIKKGKKPRNKKKIKIKTRRRKAIVMEAARENILMSSL